MTRITVPLVAIALCTGCNPEFMTAGEALQALDESGKSSRGEEATQESVESSTEPVEITTDQTIGDALQAAALELAAFWESQVPCTDVTQDGAVVTVDYGTLEDDCTFNGHTYAGITQVTVAKTDPGELEVAHDWYGLTNGEVTVDGGAVVNWSANSRTRQLVTDHTWTDNRTAETVDVVGEHEFGLIDESRPLLGGFTLEGTRDWSSDLGDWHLDMIEVEFRLQDPVPQAGTYALTNPDGKSLDLVFTRIDAATIRVELIGTRRPLVYDINKLGIPREVKGAEPTPAE